jgi:hypothetical protein
LTLLLSVAMPVTKKNSHALLRMEGRGVHIGPGEPPEVVCPWCGALVVYQSMESPLGSDIHGESEKQQS